MSPRRKFDRFMVHVDIAHNLKRANLTPAERCCHVEGVLALAAKSPVPGHLLVGLAPASESDVARLANTSRALAHRTMTKLRAVGILFYDEELQCEVVHDWAEWNPPPKKDPTNAERQARHRANVKARNAESNGTSNAPVTLISNATEEKRRERKELPNGSSSSEIAKATPEVTGLCQLLADLIRQRDPKAKPNPASDGWLRPMRLLLADRDNDAAEVERVLRWSQQDSFWQSNVLCPAKLRKQFTALSLRMDSPQLRAVQAKPWTGAIRQALNEAAS